MSGFSFALAAVSSNNPFQLAVLCRTIVYTNSLLATLNARKMIFNSGNNTVSTIDISTVSSREFPRQGGAAIEVELLHACLFEIRTYGMQHGPIIPIQITTKKELITDHDMHITKVTREVCEKNLRLMRLIIF
jgi:hypothetical protein